MPGYDTALRRKATRGGRDKGCRVYIAAEELQRAGINPYDPAPYYRVWAGKRGRFIITLYNER